MITKAPRRKINWSIVISVMITYSFMIGTAYVSFGHIVTTSRWLGLDGEAWTVPWLIDGLAILGLIGRAPKNTPGTRAGGLVLVAVGGALSLTCNVLAGHNLGQRLYGVLIVGVFVLAEWYSGRLRQTPAAVKPAGKGCPPGCSCGKHNPRRKPAGVKPRSRKPKAPRPSETVEELDRLYAAKSAPVSGA